jgi:hypothetical protein
VSTIACTVLPILTHRPGSAVVICRVAWVFGHLLENTACGIISTVAPAVWAIASASAGKITTLKLFVPGSLTCRMILSDARTVGQNRDGSFFSFGSITVRVISGP